MRACVIIFASHLTVCRTLALDACFALWVLKSCNKTFARFAMFFSLFWAVFKRWQKMVFFTLTVIHETWRWTSLQKSLRSIEGLKVKNLRYKGKIQKRGVEKRTRSVHSHSKRRKGGEKTFKQKSEKRTKARWIIQYTPLMDSFVNL